MANDWTYYANISRDVENERNNNLRQREADAEKRLSDGRSLINSSFDSAFTPNFYDKYSSSLLDYWRPDMERQYGDATRSLNYDFARTQPGGGSAPAEAAGRLKEAYDKATLQATDSAKGQAQQLRQSVEGQRGSLLSLLQSGADPSTIVQQTQGAISAVPKSPTYSALGDIFGNLTQQFSVATQAARQGYPGWGFSVGAPPAAGAASGKGSFRIY